MPIQKARKGFQMSLPTRHRFLFGMLPHPRVKKKKKKRKSLLCPTRNKCSPSFGVSSRSAVFCAFPLCFSASLLSAFAPEWDHSQKGRKSQADEGRGGDGSVLLASCAGSGTWTATEARPAGRARGTLTGFSFVIDCAASD